MTSLDSAPLAVLLLLACVMPAVCAGAERPAFTVPLVLREDQGVARREEPVAGGIPFPKGAVTNPGHIRVLDPRGRPIPCQAHQLGLSWPDGSLRWALVQFQASVGARKSATYTLRASTQGRAPMPPARVQVRDAGDQVLVNTGPMRFSVSRKAIGLPNAVWLAGKPVVRSAPRVELAADYEHMTPEEFQAGGRDPKELVEFGLADTGKVKWGRVQPGVDFSRIFTGPASITVEERGPLRAVLRLENAGEPREGDLRLVARLYAYAGRKVLGIELGVLNCEDLVAVAARDPQAPSWERYCISNVKHIRRYTYRVAPELGGAATVTVGTGAGAREVPAGQTVALKQLGPDAAALQIGGPGVQTDAKDGGLPAGPPSPVPGLGQAPGWIEAAGPRHRVALAAHRFAEVYPKAVAWDGKQLSLELWPADAPGTGYPLTRARMRTHEFLLGFDTPGPELSAMARAGLRPYPDPEYVTGTGATHRFVPVGDRRFSLYGDYVRRTYEAAQKVALAGDIDYGDQIGWNADQRWNGYHGVTHEWFLFFLASGDPRYFREAEAAAWHSLDVDTFHWGRQAGARESEYGRKQDHLCAWPDQGSIKTWNFGEVDYYFLTGKRRVWESLRRNAHFLLGAGGVTEGNLTPERASSLPFLHIGTMYEALGDEAALAAAYPKAMRSGRASFRVDSIGREESAHILEALIRLNRHFDGVYDRGEHLKSAFLASYPAEACHRFYALTGDPMAARGVLKAADFLYKQLTLPSGILMYAGGAPWEPTSVDMPWWDGVEAPSALAYLVSGDRKCLEWGKAPVDWILNIYGRAYSSGPWSFQGAMGMGGTLPTYLWAMRQAGMTQDDLSRMRPDIDYDVALKDLMARAMAKYESASTNGSDSGPYCRLAAEVGRVLLNLGRHEEAIAWLQKWQGKPYSIYVDWVMARAKAAQAGAPPAR